MPWLTILLLGLLSPSLPHWLGAACWVYLPGHVPALLGGLWRGWRGGLLGAAGLLAGEFLVDGPRGLSLYKIVAEVFTYGLVAGLLVRPRASLPRRYAALLGAMLAGRLVYALLAVSLEGRTFDRLVQSLLLTPWPGIALQLALLPALSWWLDRRSPR